MSTVVSASEEEPFTTNFTIPPPMEDSSIAAVRMRGIRHVLLAFGSDGLLEQNDDASRQGSLAALTEKAEAST